MGREANTNENQGDILIAMSFTVNIHLTSLTSLVESLPDSSRLPATGIREGFCLCIEIV